MSTPNENPSAAETPIFDPFPEPSGYPSGWDLSGITPDPEPVSFPQGALVTSTSESTED